MLRLAATLARPRLRVRRAEDAARLLSTGTGQSPQISLVRKGGGKKAPPALVPKPLRKRPFPPPMPAPRLSAKKKWDGYRIVRFSSTDPIDRKPVWQAMSQGTRTDWEALGWNANNWATGMDFHWGGGLRGHSVRESFRRRFLDARRGDAERFSSRRRMSVSG